jgi:hypothetical protein
MQASFLDTYEARYAPLLGARTEGFRLIFQELERRRSALGAAHRPWIIETGSLRQLDNWAGDGQSTRLFDHYANHCDGSVISIDIDPMAQRMVVAHCTAKVTSIAADSVRSLWQLATSARGRKVDLLYLDSYDFDPANPFPSAFHHVKELVSAIPLLDEGSIVAVDDNFLLSDGGKIGKGSLVWQWFADIGLAPLHDGYQYVWRYRSHALS